MALVGPFPALPPPSPPSECSIQAHTSSLVQWTYDHLAALRHSNGAPVLAIFGKHDRADRDQVGFGGRSGIR